MVKEQRSRCPTCGHWMPISRGLLDDRKFEAFMLLAKGKYKPYWRKWRLHIGGLADFIKSQNIRTLTGKPVSRVYFSTEITKALKATFGLKGSAETIKLARGFRPHSMKKTDVDFGAIYSNAPRTPAITAVGG